MQKPISITAISSVSPLGNSLEEAWTNYQDNKHFIIERYFGEVEEFVAELSEETKQEIATLREADDKYKALDDSVLFAIVTSRKAIEDAKWKASDNFGVNIGSSRGATSLFEKYHEDFLSKNKSHTLSSPTTTLGNISSWVAHDLQTKGPEISHSITCSTALHAMLNGIAWINSGMCHKFLVGGSEAPLTPFTVAQMKALKIYARNNDDYPCRASDVNKKSNTMVLGEGASMACLEAGEIDKALAVIRGLGYATELLKHSVSLSVDGACFQQSMAMAIQNLNENVDIIITHTPGTTKGDAAEYNAIKAVFGNTIPALTNNKWKLGHTLGASGMLSVEMAILMLQKQKFISVPFLKEEAPKQIKNILINAVGFGGNAVSILLSK